MRGESLPSCSVVVPVFNGAETVSELVDRIDDALAPVVREWEILLVNDGSRDASWEVIRGVASRRPRVEGLDLDANHGQLGALLVGIAAARYDVVLTLDDDLQHDPDDAPRLLAAIAAGDDLVYGVPARSRHRWWKRVTSRLGRRMLGLATGSPIFGHLQSYRAFRRSRLDLAGARAGRTTFFDELLWEASPRISSVPIVHGVGRRGGSTYSLPHLLRFALPALLARGRWWRVALLATLLSAGLVALALAVVRVALPLLGGDAAPPGALVLPGLVAGLLVPGMALAALHLSRRRLDRPPGGVAATVRARARFGDGRGAGDRSPAADGIGPGGAGQRRAPE